MNTTKAATTANVTVATIRTWCRYGKESAVTELHTATGLTWEQAQAIIDSHASTAYALAELTAIHDPDWNDIVLDPETRTVWWAWTETPGGSWTVEQLTPTDAAEQASAQIGLIQSRMDDLTEYAEGHASLMADQAALDEYAEVLRLGLPADPRVAAEHIKHHRRLLAHQDALWQRAYAAMVRDLAGTERGGKAGAARALGVTDVQVGRIIREDDQRRDALRNAIQDARASRA